MKSAKGIKVIIKRDAAAKDLPLPHYATSGSSGMDLYKRLAGEAEARNVQTRMGFNPAERMAKPPWTTLDVLE